MTQRYRSAVDHIWSDEGRFNAMLQAAKVTAHATAQTLDTDDRAALIDGVHALCTGDRDDVAVVRDRAEMLERDYHHDVAAFVEAIREWLHDNADASAARWWHHGRTSSDLVEPALAFQLQASHRNIQSLVSALVSVTAAVADTYRDTPVIGKTHGRPAEPTSIGRKFALHARALRESFPRSTGSVAKVSGPVGTDAAANRVLTMHGLHPAPSTQIAPRHHMDTYVSQLAVFAGALSRLATEIRLGARDGWLTEPQGSAQRGSSVMAHKINPVRSERAVGLCKVIRSDCFAVIESHAELWEERDISHSSVERTALVRALQLTAFVTADMTGVLGGLVIDADRAAIGTGEPTSAYVLAEAVAAGTDREVAYSLIRDVGPSEAAHRLSVVGAAPDYDPNTEPELWGERK